MIIAEMLIKQDETTGQIKENTTQIKEVATQVKEVATQVKEVATQVKETNNILRHFMGLSIKQWEQQQIFNEVFASELKGIKRELSALVQIDQGKNP